jgi:GABA permease
MRRCLVVANQTLAGHHLLEHVCKCSAMDACWFYVLVPATPTHLQVMEADGDAVLMARCRLEAALARFRAEGATAVGAVGDPNPLRAVAAACRSNRFDEIILSTLPPGTSHWLMVDLPARLARLTGLPVTHLVAEHQPVPEVTGPDA